jgi:hypothetical protein
MEETRIQFAPVPDTDKVLPVDLVAGVVRICCMSGSSIVSTRTPQITPVISPASGFSRAPAKKSAKVVPEARCRSSSAWSNP